jgi:hypothetical protein
MLASYQRLGSRPVAIDEQRIRGLGVRVVSEPVAAESEVIRHDSEALALSLLRLLK